MSRYRNTMSELLKEVRGIKEQDKDHEVSMARGELEAIADKATQLASMLQSKSDEGNPLEAWVQSKITKAKDYINSVSDYMMYNPDMKQNEELEEQTWAQQSTQMFRTIATAAGYKKPSSGDGYQAIWDYRNGKGKFQGKGKKTIKQTQDWIYRNGYKLSTDYLKDILGEETILEYTQQQIKQAYGILNDPRYKGGNYDGAVKAIEKFAKGLSNHPDVANALKRANEELKEEIKPEQLKKLKDSWKDIKLMSPEKVKTLKNFLDRHSTDSLMQLAQANINFVSNMARSVMNKRKVGDPKHAGSMKEDAAQDMEKVAKLRIQQMKIQTKVQKMDKADPKNKTPLAIAKNDLDNLQMRMDQLKDRAQKTKNEEVHPAKALIEAIEAVKNKAEKTGMPYSILKQVYDRGMAAWKGGHRPGTTPQQWALARVNSFVTKSSGTWGGADSDLAKKVRSKK